MPRYVVFVPSTLNRLLVVFLGGAVAASAGWVAVGVAIVGVPVGTVVARVGLEEESRRRDHAIGWFSTDRAGRRLRRLRNRALGVELRAAVRAGIGVPGHLWIVLVRTVTGCNQYNRYWPAQCRLQRRTRPIGVDHMSFRASRRSVLGLAIAAISLADAEIAGPRRRRLTPPASSLGWSDSFDTGNGLLNIVTTVAPISSIARNVGGTRINLPGSCRTGRISHTFEPAPSDAVMLSKADVVFVNGLQLEQPTMDLAKANLKDGAEIDSLGDKTISPDQYVYDFSFPKDEGKPNPHLWMNPVFAAELRDADLGQAVRARCDQCRLLRGESRRLPGSAQPARPGDHGRHCDDSRAEPQAADLSRFLRLFRAPLRADRDRRGAAVGLLGAVGQGCGAN